MNDAEMLSSEQATALAIIEEIEREAQYIRARAMKEMGTTQLIGMAEYSTLTRLATGFRIRYSLIVLQER